MFLITSVESVSITNGVSTRSSAYLDTYGQLTGTGSTFFSDEFQLSSTTSCTYVFVAQGTSNTTNDVAVTLLKDGKEYYSKSFSGNYSDHWTKSLPAGKYKLRVINYSPNTYFFSITIT